jgi:putative transcriptional regulator
LQCYFGINLLGSALALILLAAAAPAQIRVPVKELAAGRFLVARRGLVDPNFARTVVLLAQTGKDGAMGLIINRQTKLPISRVLEGIQEAKDRSDPAYLGGPVSITGVLALVRSRTKLEDATHVLADVYLVSDRKVLEKTLAARADAGSVRIYLGYAGWAPGQLEMELELGSWYILRGDPAVVFDPEPDTVWDRLIQGTEARIASAVPLLAAARRPSH